MINFVFYTYLIFTFQIKHKWRKLYLSLLESTRTILLHIFGMLRTKHSRLYPIWEINTWNSSKPYQKTRRLSTMSQNPHNSLFQDTSILILRRTLAIISHVSRKKMAPNNNRPRTLKTSVCKASNGLATRPKLLLSLSIFPKSSSNKNSKISIDMMYCHLCH